MAGYIPLSKASHKQFGFQADKPFEFAQNWPFIPVSSEELGKLLSFYPICFQKGEQGYQVGIPTGLGAVNCLVHPQNGKFLLPYVPAILRRYPFNMLKSEQGEPVLCVVDEEAGFAKGRGEAVIDAEGELSEKGQALVNFLNQLNRSFERVNAVCQQLDALGLLIPLPFQVKDEQSGDLKSVREDLYRVDEQRLNQLSAEDLHTLMSQGAFPVIYAHLFSLQKLDQVGAAAQAYAKLSSAGKKAEVQDLDALFGEDDSDVLRFE